MGDAELSPDIERLAKKWEKDPSSKVFAQLGDLYRKAKLYDEAIQVLSKGLELNPNYAPGHLVMAKTYLDQMRSAMAKEELEKVLAIDPQNVVALRLIAPIVEKGGSDEELTRIYELILSVDPGDQSTFEKLDQLKKRKAQRAEAAPDTGAGGEFQVETFQQFRPPSDKGETISDVKSDLVDQMVVEPLQKEPTFAKDLPEEKIEVEPYVDKPGADIKSTEEVVEEKVEIEPYVDRPGADIKSSETEEVVEEELEIERDVAFQTSTEEPVVEEKIDTSIMGQLTGGKEIKEEEIVDEEIELQSDLMSQMGAAGESSTETGEATEKIDTDIMGQLTGEPSAQPEPEVEKVEPPEAEVPKSTASEPLVEQEPPPTTEEVKREEISSIEDVLETKPKEEVPTVDDILKPEEPETKPVEEKEEQKEEPEKEKDSIQSFREWLDGLTK